MCLFFFDFCYISMYMRGLACLLLVDLFVLDSTGGWMWNLCHLWSFILCNLAYLGNKRSPMQVSQIMQRNILSEVLTLALFHTIFWSCSFCFDFYLFCVFLFGFCFLSSLVSYLLFLSLFWLFVSLILLFSICFISFFSQLLFSCFPFFLVKFVYCNM